MALPKLEVSTYTTIMPSTGKAVKFRSFLVKEEKILLLAQESKENAQIIQALKDVITSCTFDKLNVDEMTTYDLEYMFIQLRMKSVGEIVDLQTKCKACEKNNTFRIDLNDVKVNMPEEPLNARIQLTDSVGVIARAIPVSDADAISEKTEDFLKMIALCIDSVYDNDKVWTRKDMNQEELIEFISGFNHEQLARIEQYVSAQPKLTYSTDIECTGCKAPIHIELKGLQDFFQ